MSTMLQLHHILLENRVPAVMSQWSYFPATCTRTKSTQNYSWFM